MKLKYVYNPFKEITIENEKYFGKKIYVYNAIIRSLFTQSFFWGIGYFTFWVNDNNPLSIPIYIIAYLAFVLIGYKIQSVDYDKYNMGWLGGLINNPFSITDDFNRAKAALNGFVRLGYNFAINWILLKELFLCPQNFKQEWISLELEKIKKTLHH